LLWAGSDITDSIISNGIRDSSGSSKEDILRIYSGENRRTRREKVRKEGSEAWRGRKAVRARLVSIPIDPVLIPVILTNTGWY
jgi:hypothetical protein